jgi:bacteriocin-like protein
MKNKKSITPLNIITKKEMKNIYGGDEEACGECWAGPYSCGDPCTRPVSVPPDCQINHCFGMLLCTDHISFNS